MNIQAPEPSAYAPVKVDPIRLASATIQAVDRLGAATSEEIEKTADEIMRGATEIAEKLRALASAIREHSKIANEHVSGFCSKATSVLEGVPRALPAMVKAMRLQEKAKQVGFEWDNREQVWDKVEEEMAELKEAEQLNSAPKTEEELGDLFFSLINYARFLQVDAENALEKTNKKFIYRFTKMEQEAGSRQR